MRASSALHNTGMRGAGVFPAHLPKETAVNAVNRMFVALLSLAWIALMAGLVYLVWNPGEFIELNGSTVATRFEILLDTTAEQTLATIVLGLLMLPAVMLLFMEATIHDRRASDASAELKLERDRNRALSTRVNDLEKELGREHKEDAETVRRAADNTERVETHDLDRDRDRVTPARKWHVFGR
jgi:hypothetical protein